MKRIVNTIVLIIVAVAVIALLMMWLQPKPAKVDAVKAVRGPLQSTVDG